LHFSIKKFHTQSIIFTYYNLFSIFSIFSQFNKKFNSISNHSLKSFDIAPSNGVWNFITKTFCDETIITYESHTLILKISYTHRLIFSLLSRTLFLRKSTASTNATTSRRERTAERNERSGSSTTDNEMPASSERTVTTHHQKKTVITSPKQRYYLGENPYAGGSLFGKENKYVPNGSANRESEIVKQKNYYNSSSSHSPARRLRSEEPTAG
jgi:hypothetical protein